MKVFLAWLCLSGAAFALENELNQLFGELAEKTLQIQNKTLAVIPFNVSASGTSQEAGRMVAEYAVSFYSSQNRFQLIERMAFKKVADELALSQTGMIQEDKALEAGKMLSADYLLTGSIMDAPGKRMISARLIKTETAEVIAGSSITVTSDQLNSLKDVLGEKTGMSGAIYRSAALPGWGQFYTGHPWQGSLFTGLAVLSIGTIVWSVLDYNDKNNVVTSFNEGRNVVPGETVAQNEIRKDKAVDDKNKASGTVNMAIGITAGVWIVNMVDAAICGRHEAQRVKQLYFTFNPETSDIRLNISCHF
jgi:TolB-like protein